MIVAEKRRKANQKTLKLDNEPLIKPINFRGLIRQLADLGINFKFSRVGGALKLVLPLSSEVCHGKAISLLKRLAFILPTLIKDVAVGLEVNLPCFQPDGLRP
jgi:hypothetical protein